MKDRRPNVHPYIHGTLSEWINVELDLFIPSEYLVVFFTSVGHSNHFDLWSMSRL